MLEHRAVIDEPTDDDCRLRQDDPDCRDRTADGHEQRSQREADFAERLNRGFAMTSDE